jgi:hypothetical protein
VLEDKNCVKMKNDNYKWEGILINILKITCVGAILILFNSCGTMVGGRIEACQKRKPTVGHREINPLVFLADVPLFPIALPVDFFTGAIYKSCSFYESSAINKKAVRAMKNR